MKFTGYTPVITSDGFVPASDDTFRTGRLKKFIEAYKHAILSSALPI